MESGLIVRVVSRETLDLDLIGEVKARLFLDADVTDYDTLLGSEIKRAIESVENYTGLAIGPQTRKASYTVLTELTRLPYGPYVDLVSGSPDGVIDDDGLLSADWPAGGTITYRCGYDADTLPAGLKSAIVLAAAEYSGLRPDLKPNGWRALARPYSAYTWAD